MIISFLSIPIWYKMWALISAYDKLIKHELYTSLFTFIIFLFLKETNIKSHKIYK